MTDKDKTESFETQLRIQKNKALIDRAIKEKKMRPPKKVVVFTPKFKPRSRGR